ncbi:MAG: hypothetical protein KGS72_24245 [Cyanobacteria bacterium REEB67]|nr:hypothetical protein [Cyanobacteria bacterium REEB67]
MPVSGSRIVKNLALVSLLFSALNYPTTALALEQADAALHTVPLPDATGAGSIPATVSDKTAPAIPSDTANPGIASDTAASTKGPATKEPAAASKREVGRTSRFGRVLRANIIQTFQLDPRLKKDLTEGNPALRPIKLMQDYVAIGYNPVMEWDKAGTPGWAASYGKTNMSVYVVGPITKHISTWYQPLPLVNSQGIFQHTEVAQGLVNYGTDKTLVQFQGGQGFNFQNSGWGGADRTITQTVPGVYTAFNGFDPTAPTKTVSLSASACNWTTGRIFGFWQPGASTSSDSNITYNRGHGVGMTVEKLIGKTGISGIQSNLTMGNSPLFNANTGSNGLLIGKMPARYVTWTSWINKSFQDKKGYVRFNPSFGLNATHIQHYMDDPALPQSDTTQYGYTFDLVAIPVLSYWTSILRYDQFQPNRLTQNNTTFTFTSGQALDLHLPNKAKLRLTFDYQLVGQHTQGPSHRLIFGLWPIW